MRNLLRFFAKNYFILLFVLIEIVCFVLIFNYNNYQKVRFINSSNVITGSIYESYNSISGYFKLKQVNQELSEQIADLQNQLQKFEIVPVESLAPIHSLDTLNDDSLTIETDTVQTQELIIKDSIQYQYISTRVINNSVNKQHNYITLNKGSNDGIEPDMGIIGPKGVVGIVTNVSANYSTGPTILNTRWKVSAKIKKNNYFGSLGWDGFNPQIAQLNEIPYHVDLAIGDTIVTSGYSSVFPEGVLIGFVEDFNQESGENFYSINVRLSSSFQALQNVEIIKNTQSSEVLSIQENTMTDE